MVLGTIANAFIIVRHLVHIFAFRTPWASDDQMIRSHTASHTRASAPQGPFRSGRRIAEQGDYFTLMERKGLYHYLYATRPAEQRSRRRDAALLQLALILYSLLSTFPFAA